MWFAHAARLGFRPDRASSFRLGRLLLIRKAPTGKNAMRFDIFFQPCCFGSVAVEKKIPFTGEVQPVAANEPLNATEVKAHGPDEHGCDVGELDDGGRAAGSGTGDRLGCTEFVPCL